MEYFFAGSTIALLLVALREEFRPGGSLHVQLRAARSPREVLVADPFDVVYEAGTISIVSPRGVEIPVSRLTAHEIVVALADIDRIEELEVA